MDFSETIVVYDIKVGRFSQLNEYMNLCEYQRSMSFTDLCPRSLIFKLQFSRARFDLGHICPPLRNSSNTLFSRLILILSLQIKISHVPACYLEVIAIVRFHTFHSQQKTICESRDIFG